MKKSVLFALLVVLTAGAGVAQTYHHPTANVDYSCDYTGTPPNSAAAWGLSLFSISLSTDASGKPIWRGIEYYDATYGGDNRKVTFAKPSPKTWYPGWGWGTRWEFTINPYGPQCKYTDVINNGALIFFAGCTDGHSRTCQRLY